MGYSSDLLVSVRGRLYLLEAQDPLDLNLVEGFSARLSASVSPRPSLSTVLSCFMLSMVGPREFVFRNPEGQLCLVNQSLGQGCGLGLTSLPCHVIGTTYVELLPWHVPTVLCHLADVLME